MAGQTTSKASNTWEGVMQAAKAAGAKYPELVAAQWALESGWGKHTSGRHNYFGLKGEGSDCVTPSQVLDALPVVWPAMDPGRIHQATKPDLSQTSAPLSQNSLSCRASERGIRTLG